MWKQSGAFKRSRNALEHVLYRGGIAHHIDAIITAYQWD